jgi:hypothetical protein
MTAAEREWVRREIAAAATAAVIAAHHRTLDAIARAKAQVGGVGRAALVALERELGEP